METGRVRFGARFLSRRPEFEGKVLYFEPNKLVEKEESEVKAELEAVAQSSFDNNLSIGASWAAWQTLEENGIDKDLKEVLGGKAKMLLWLAVYVYLTGGESMDGFAEWLKGHWLPEGKPLDGRRISELLSNITDQDIKNYCKKRFERSQRKLDELAEKEGDRQLRNNYFALNSTMAIGKAEYSTAKQAPELRRTNLTLVSSCIEGDVCYAFLSNGPITDKVLFKALLGAMIENGFDISTVVFVNHCSDVSLGNIQYLVDSEADFVCGIPLSEKYIRICSGNTGRRSKARTS